MWKVWLVCTLVVVSVVACRPPKRSEKLEGRNNLYSTGDGAQFRCQLSQRLGPEADTLHMVVATSIPYDNLIFLRTDSGYVATFELVTSLFTDSAGLFSEKIIDSYAKVPSFDETNSRSRNVARVQEFLVPPATYKVRVTLTTEREAHKKSHWEGSITLARSDPRLRISDIYWESEDRSLKELGVPKLVDNFSTTDSSATAVVQLYSSLSTPIHLTWALVNAKSDTIRHDEASIPPTGTVQEATYAVELSNLTPQRYTLKVRATADDREETRERSFGVRVAGIPMNITNLDLAVRQLKYIATSQWMSKLRSAPADQKEKVFKEFWQDQAKNANADANELMEEYYRRVEYANEHFATNRAGWESDRGRIYVTYGEPTDIERHPFEAGSRPYEIWYYNNIARRFIFVDYTGFGDYTLVGPEWGY
jgi:GWxTD domain-containing protein